MVDTVLFKRKLRHDATIMRENGWGKSSPVDFWDAGEERTVTNRKWWPWTAANDLAGKEFMEGGNYLVRCTICKKEKFQPSGVFICDEPECKEAVSVLLELGYESDWGEVADQWYTTWYEEEPGRPEMEGLAESINREANQSVDNALKVRRDNSGP